MPAPDTCIEWGRATTSSGYGAVWMGSRVVTAHRVAYECDNRKCVNVKHLRLGTQGDNLRDMTNKGRHGHTKLSDSDVDDIRSRIEAGQTGASLAREYGVSQSLISSIKLRRSRNIKQGEHSVRAS